MSPTPTASMNSPRNKHSTDNGAYEPPRIDVTKDEFARIEKAMKNEEFRKMFLDYCDEIQDPENLKIYEQEITQLEAERGVEVTFIHPEPGFVIKTSVGGSLKCFVNVAKCPEVGKPTSEVTVNSETGGRGLNWAIPMAQTAPHEDLDAHGKRCRVFDVVFHPDALYLAQRNQAFHKCLIDTALDAVEREYKVNLDRTNLKFPKLEFKGIARPTVIRKLAKNSPPEANEPHPLESIFPAKPTEHTAEPKVLPLKTKVAAKPEFSTPKYRIKHRRNVDLAECTNELDAKLNLTVPRELVVEIDLPLLNSTAECQLDVTAKSLYLLSERSGAKYRLKLDLPFVVDDKAGSARFDTDVRKLCITLPVVQQTSATQRQLHDTLLHLNREDSGVECDMRDDRNSQSESPVEELSDTLEEATLQAEDAAIKAPAALIPPRFLKNSNHYQFPAKFDCNVLDNVMSFVLHVHNVQAASIETLQHAKDLHIQFASLGSGFYPTHYAFYVQLPADADVGIESAEAEAWENNVVLNLNLAATSESIDQYLAGIDSNDLKEYAVQKKFQVTQKVSLQEQRPSQSSSLEISVERSECERSVEIEIKPREQLTAGAANNTEDEEPCQHSTMQQAQKKLNKRHSKKKNKKHRSLSESACDDIKAYQQHQQQLQQIESASNSSQTNDEHSSTEHSETKVKQSKSLYVTVPTTNTAQQRKQRSYSECRDGIGMSTSYKGILKHYSRYDRPSMSISDSSSSIDECSSYSWSAEAGVSNALRFSQSFSDIPEENVTAGLSESCKKTVRFNEVIKKQVFKHDSSILGQRKKNQKRRDRKQRALQRRLSEGDSADYEDNNKVHPLHISSQYFERNDTNYKNNDTATHYNKNNNSGKEESAAQHDSGLDLSAAEEKANNNEKSKYKKAPPQVRLESESSTDMETTKNSLMFEMDM